MFSRLVSCHFLKKYGNLEGHHTGLVRFDLATVGAKDAYYSGE